MVATKRLRRKNEESYPKDKVMTGYIEGLVIIAFATALTVWINDTFDVGGDYVEMTPES